MKPIELTASNSSGKQHLHISFDYGTGDAELAITGVYNGRAFQLDFDPIKPKDMEKLIKKLRRKMKRAMREAYKAGRKARKKESVSHPRLMQGVRLSGCSDANLQMSHPPCYLPNMPGSCH